MGIAQRARDSIRNIWSHGEEEEFERDEAEAHEPDAYHAPRPERVDRAERSDTPRYDPAPPARGGGSGSNPNVRRATAVPLRLPSSRDKQIYTIRPHGLEEAAAAADFLKTGSAVVVNLDDVDRSTAVRIIDFMSGVCYGLDAQGHAMKLGATIFLFTPGDFEITSDEPDYDENTDIFFREVPTGTPETALEVAAQAPAPSVAQPASQTEHATGEGPIIERTVIGRSSASDRVVIDNSTPAPVRPAAERPSVPRPWER